MESPKIILLDSSKLPRMSTYREDDGVVIPARVPEPRVVTLSPNSLRLLKSFGVMDIVEDKCVTPFHDMLVYEQVGQSYMRFNNKKHQKSSPLVQLQERFMKDYLFDKKAFEETQEMWHAAHGTPYVWTAKAQADANAAAEKKRLKKCLIRAPSLSSWC